MKPTNFPSKGLIFEFRFSVLILFLGGDEQFWYKLLPYLLVKPAIKIVELRFKMLKSIQTKKDLTQRITLALNVLLMMS